MADVSGGAAALAAAVIARRAQLHLTQRALARKAQVSPRTIWNVEHGQRATRPGTVRAVLGALGMPAATPPARAPGLLCLVSEEQMITCDQVFVIECGHPSGIEGIEEVPGAVVLSCTEKPGHDGDLHHDIEGIWWTADGDG